MSDAIADGAFEFDDRAWKRRRKAVTDEERIVLEIVDKAVAFVNHADVAYSNVTTWRAYIELKHAVRKLTHPTRLTSKDTLGSLG